MPCQLVNRLRRFVGVYYLHVQGQAVQAISICVVSVEGRESLCLFYGILKILKRLCSTEWAFAPFALDLPGNAVT
jgi:hypothetical protein